MNTASRHTSSAPKERSLLHRVGMRLRREEAELPLASRLFWALAGLTLVVAAVVITGNLLGVLGESPILGIAYKGLGMSVALALLALVTRGMGHSSEAPAGSEPGASDATEDQTDFHPEELGDSDGLFDTDAAILEAMEVRERVDEDREAEAVAYELADSDEASLEEARNALRHRVTVTRRDLDQLDGTLLGEALDGLEDGMPSSGDARTGFLPGCLMALVGRDRYRARRGVVRWFCDLVQ